MHIWQQVSRREPCSICGRPDWCATSLDGAWDLCRRVDTGIGVHKVDKAGADFWLYRLDGSAPVPQPVIDLPSLPSTQRADAAILDQVYRALLAMLALSAGHRQSLRQRGLTDTEILRRRYRTLPLQGRAALATRLVEHCGADVCAQVPGCYVAERDGRTWWSLAGAAGMLIPVRNLGGQVVALKVRADVPGAGSKYTTLSSAKHGGPSPGAPAHVPLSRVVAYVGTQGTFGTQKNLSILNRRFFVLTATALFEELRAQGVHLTVQGAQLAVDAPKGVLTDPLRQAIRQHKTALMDLWELWEERAAIMEYDGKLPRDKVEALAWECLCAHEGLLVRIHPLCPGTVVQPLAPVAVEVSP